LLFSSPSPFLYTFYCLQICTQKDSSTIDGNVECVHYQYSCILFLVIFDTCDVVYNWSVSLLPPIVLWSIWYVPNYIVFNKEYFNFLKIMCTALSGRNEKKPQTRYKQTANQLLRTGRTRDTVVLARHATFPLQIFYCHPTAFC